jgi:hypothetical protein
LCHLGWFDAFRFYTHWFPIMSITKRMYLYIHIVLKKTLHVITAFVVTCSMIYYTIHMKLFFCLFWVARAIFHLSGDCNHYRWQGCKFRPMLST